MKTYYYVGRIKSHGNTCAALRTTTYHGTKCFDCDGFDYQLINDDRASKFWRIFDFDAEVGKVIDGDLAMELADFCDLSDAAFK